MIIFLIVCFNEQLEGLLYRIKPIIVIKISQSGKVIV